MDVDGGNGGYAVVALGNTAAAEAQPSMFYGPPSIELWENRTYCFQFNMQFQVSNTCSFGQSEFHVDPFFHSQRNQSTNDFKSFSAVVTPHGETSFEPWVMDGKDVQQTSWLRAQFPINPASFGATTEPPYKYDYLIRALFPILS